MGIHCKTLSAIFPMLLNYEGKCRKILLHRRQNTGYEDGKWDIAGSGHVDEGETARSAVIRECAEELGIMVQSSDLDFVHLSHRFSMNRVYYDIYFAVNNYSGKPTIMEPGKCSELEWFDLENLPYDIIECRREDIQHYIDGVSYSEKVNTNR